MADIPVDGRTAVWYLPTIASASLIPTIAEFTAGKKISAFLTPTGLVGFDPSQADIDSSSLETSVDSKLPGRTSYSGTQLMFKKQDVAAPHELILYVENTLGYIAIRDDVLATAAIAVSQKVEIYGGRTGRAFTQGRGEANSLLRMAVPWAIDGAKVSNGQVTIAA